MTSSGTPLVMTSPSPSSPSGPGVPVIPNAEEVVVVKGRRYRQRPLGPAPFASFEDLSDELDSPPETARVVLPGIKEDPSSQVQSPSTPLPQVTTVSLTEKEEQGLKDALKNTLVASGPPRIDISRASSSSQHEDSVTSSPDRDNDTHNLGYKEDGTVDLRSSTEELDYIQEPGTVEESEERRKRERMLRRQQQVRNFGETQSQHEFVERKDSSCSVMSDVGLLCISGRTSRLSSIGSAASGGSVASGVSHLSAGSHLSGRSSRSPSPHKMLLETSFCGSKPMHSRSVEPEASPAMVTLSEKSASRPPSSLRSRSPSPHKMLLETSFCGPKPVPSSENKVHGRTQKEKASKTTKPKTTASTVVTEAEIVGPKSSSSSSQQGPPKNPPKKTPAERPNEIKTLGKAIEALTAKTTLGRLPTLEKKSAKPKKVISLRDLPVNEIYIPLKGPEVDFEEIIRRASPNTKKRPAEKPALPQSTADEIYIPLVSPTKTTTETFPAEPSKPATKPSTSAAPPKSKTETSRVSAPVKEKPKMREYEVCEDGSIYIPLHSPDENKRWRHLDAEENSERTERQTEMQGKPETLDLSHTTSKSQPQTLSAGKSEITSAGSRTPSPGSSLSRKSSFVNLFRKSDVTGSPDSQSGGSCRKKSGTLSVTSRDTTEGSRDRSHSRSKSNERVSGSSSGSSGKKNVFTNLFGKKKTGEKTGSRVKDSEEGPGPRFDLQFTFSSGAEPGRKTADDEGDYIIIPLRDPSDPPGSLDVETEEGVLGLEEDKSVGDATKVEPEGEVEASAKTSQVSKSPTAGESAGASLTNDSKSSGKKPQKQSSPDLCSEVTLQIEQSKPLSGVTEIRGGEEGLDMGEIGQVASEKDFTDGKVPESDQALATSLDEETVLNANDGTTREEVLTVTADGVRKLKLPPEPGDLDDDHERKGLVYQESFEDELPYVPTTLPQERSLGVPIVPVKQRMTEIKTCPIERPRSTTPINPTTLEDFVASKEISSSVSEEEKMKISLPRDDSITSRGKSPRRFSAKGKSWFEFAEEGLQSPRDHRKTSLRTSPSPPPLPPRSSSPSSEVSTTAPPTTTSWINFEALPEKKKLPKRITTVPALRGPDDGGNASDKGGSPAGGNVVYSYVSPEDCQCECHEHNASHHGEPDSKKGTRDLLPSRREVNGSDRGKRRPKERSVTQQDSEKSECKYCEVEKHSEWERDAEERPLLEENSDGDNEEDIGPSKPFRTRSDDEGRGGRGGDVKARQEERTNTWDPVKTRSRSKRERSSPLSDSSSDGTSHEVVAGVDEEAREKTISKPFEMDLHVGSNRSSIISQEDLISLDESSSDPH